MFFTLILENQTGDQTNMTATANQYMTSKIEGLSPPAGTISTSGYYADKIPAYQLSLRSIGYSRNVVSAEEFSDDAAFRNSKIYL